LSEDFFTWRHALSGNPISIDGGNDFDAHASWGEILVTIAMSAVALALVTFFALLIGNA
jgi:ABC-type phosphate/phosphonate transport system permease subunit